MIAFLLIVYLLFVWLIFIRFKLLPFDLKAKIAVAVIGIFGSFGILIAVNFLHPQSMDARVLEHVIGVSLRTSQSARVTEVRVEPNQPVKAGDILFVVDDRIYVAEVARLEASLAEAEQSVLQLGAAYQAALAAVERVKQQLALAEIEEARDKKLVASSAISQEEYDKSVRNLMTVQSTVKQSEAQAESAKLAFEAKTTSGENVNVAQIKAELAKARIDLEETTVRAPTDGYVTNLELKPGFIIRPGEPVITFVCEPKGTVVITMPQEYLGAIEVGNEVEVCLDMYPGKTLHGKVESIILASGAGQLDPSGDLPTVTSIAPAARFPIKVKMNAEDVKQYRLPSGANGAAAIYTNHGKPFRIVRRVVLRWYTWLNFIKVGM